MFLILILSIIFIKINHPLSIGLILICQTLCIALFSGSISINFWFSYSLFLIFIGGILILFIYITSLSSNEIFKFYLNFKKIFLIILTLIIFLLFFYWFNLKNYLFFNEIKNLENNSIYFIKNLENLDKLLLNKIFRFPINLISIILINYLFLTLIARVKITNIFKGPLRPTN